MIPYHGSNPNIKNILKRKAESIRSAYTAVLEKEKFETAISLANKTLTEDVFKTGKIPSIKFEIACEGSFGDNSYKVIAAPKMFGPKNDES